MQNTLRQHQVGWLTWKWEKVEIERWFFFVRCVGITDCHWRPIDLWILDVRTFTLNSQTTNENEGNLAKGARFCKRERERDPPKSTIDVRRLLALCWRNQGFYSVLAWGGRFGGGSYRVREKGRTSRRGLCGRKENKNIVVHIKKIEKSNELNGGGRRWWRRRCRRRTMEKRRQCLGRIAWRHQPVDNDICPVCTHEKRVRWRQEKKIFPSLSCMFFLLLFFIWLGILSAMQFWVV